MSVGPSDSPRAAPPRQTAIVAFASGFRNSLGAAAFMLRFCDTWKHSNALTEPFGRFPLTYTGAGANARLN